MMRGGLQVPWVVRAGLATIVAIILLLFSLIAMNLQMAIGHNLVLEQALQTLAQNGYKAYADPSGDLYTKNVLPASNNTYGLGSITRQWKDAYVNTVYAVDATAATLNAPTGRMAEIVIAPSDASATDKAQADVVLTGTGDVAAINILIAGTAKSFGFMGGTVNVETALVPKSNMALIGVSSNITIFRVPNNTNTQIVATAGGAKRGIKITGIMFDGNKDNNTAGGTAAVNFYDGGAVYDLYMDDVVIKSYRGQGFRGTVDGFVRFKTIDNWRIGATFLAGAENLYAEVQAIGNGVDSTTGWLNRSGVYLYNITSGGSNFKIIADSNYGAGVATYNLQRATIELDTHDNLNDAMVMGGDGGANESGYNTIRWTGYRDLGGIDTGAAGLGYNDITFTSHNMTQFSVYAVSPGNNVRGTTRGNGYEAVFVGDSYNTVQVNSFNNGQTNGTNRRASIILGGGEGKDVLYTTIYASKLYNSDYGVGMIPAGKTINYTTYIGNEFSGNTIAPIQTVGANDIFGTNRGFVTVNSGNSVSTGAQQTIPHGLNITPTKQKIGVFSDNVSVMVWQSANPDATNIYVSTNATSDGSAVTGSAWHWGTIGN